MARLGAHLADVAAMERGRAVRALLRTPLLTAEGPRAADFALVRRHRQPLIEWFAEELGYHLVVESDFARLHKIASSRGPARPLTTRSDAPFDARRYTFLCLALAALDQAGDQTTLHELAQEVRARSDELAGFSVDFERLADRRAFTHGVRVLVDWGVLQVRDGDDERFARGEDGGDALYQVHHRRLAHVLAAPVPPSVAASTADLTRESYPDTSEGRARASHRRLMRGLLEEAVCYLDDLDAPERDYLAAHRRLLFREIERGCGFEVEVRQEGVAVIDPSGESTDLSFPATGTVAHAALLLGDELAHRCQNGGGDMAEAEVVEYIGELAATYGKWWRSDLSSDREGHAALAALAITRLVDFGLVCRAGEFIRPRPAMARFRAETPTLPLESDAAGEFLAPGEAGPGGG